MCVQNQGCHQAHGQKFKVIQGFSQGFFSKIQGFCFAHYLNQSSNLQGSKLKILKINDIPGLINAQLKTCGIV